VMRRLPQLYTETADVFPPAIRRMVREIGPERVLFGSNGPYQRIDMVVDFVRKYAGLTEEQARLVLGENLARIMGVAAPAGR
jgi:predicted TIM-barrel fold metal-dependent hydrolase